MSSLKARTGVPTLSPGSRPLPPRPDDASERSPRLPPPSRPNLPAVTGGSRPPSRAPATKLPLPPLSTPPQRPDLAGRTSLKLGEPFSVIGPFADSLFLFESRNTRTGRRVVAKLFKTTSDAGPADDISRFAALRHPNTVRILDYGVANTPPNVGYCIREFVDGISLQQRLLSGEGFTLEEALGLARDVTLSLAEAHGQGIVHGRLWPEHVLLEKQRSPITRARVLGYGQASIGARRDPSTWFLAPELLHGGAAGPSADTFSVAALLYACLFGEAPTVGAAVPSNDQLGLWQREGVAHFFEAALSAAPARRLASASELLAKLERLEQSVGVGTPATLGATLWCDLCDGAAAALLPPRDELTSTRDKTIWVLEGDAALTDGAVFHALQGLAREYRVKSIGSEQRAVMMNRLVAGEVAPPWVVVFGDMTVLLEDPLLALLGDCGESSLLLISSHDSYELLQNSINQIGLDQHVTLPTTESVLTEGLNELMSRTRRIYHHYDGIRLALKESREKVGELSRTLAALRAPTQPPSAMRRREAFR